MERAFIFSLQDLSHDPGQALHQTLDLSPETYPAHYNGAPACIDTGSGEGRWCLCFSASAATSSLPYLSLGELWKPPTKSSSSYQHPDGEKTEGHREPPSKQSFRKGGVLPDVRVCACKCSSVLLPGADQPPRRLPLGMISTPRTPLYLCVCYNVRLTRGLSPLLECTLTEEQTAHVN